MDKWGYNNLIEHKTLWAKEKLLVTSNFFFSYNVFKTWMLLMRQNEYLWSKGLTLYHTILTFNDPKEEGFGKHCEKRRKCWQPAFSPFPTVFSTLSKREILVFKQLTLYSINTQFDASTANRF